VSEEGVAPVAGAVEELVGDDDVGRLVLELHRADGRDRDQLLDSQELEAEDVGAVVELGGEQAVAAAVARQEGDGAAVELADDVRVRRLAERRVEAGLLAHHQPLHLIQAAAADHTDTDIAHEKHSSWEGIVASLRAGSLSQPALRPAGAVELLRLSADPAAQSSRRRAGGTASNAH